MTLLEHVIPIPHAAPVKLLRLVRHRTTRWFRPPVAETRSIRRATPPTPTSPWVHATRRSDAPAH